MTLLEHIIWHGCVECGATLTGVMDPEILDIHIERGGRCPECWARLRREREPRDAPERDGVLRVATAPRST